jgi:hypothetical protein
MLKIETYKKMSQYDIIFLSLAKNCSKYLPNYFNLINELSKNFKIKVVIGENNSNDDTKNIICKQIKINKNIKLLNTYFLKKYTNRIFRIAKGRNFLQKYIIKKKIKARYVCVMDLDNVLDTILDKKEFIKMLKLLKNKKNLYNGISVKSKPYYYDILAFSSDQFISKNILEIQSARNFFFNAYFLRKKNIYSMQKKINNFKNLVTISSFNGLCIYNYKDFIKGNYMYKNTPKKVVMNEHMNFNISLNKINKKKILIYDNFFLKTPPEHSPRKNILDFYVKKIKSLLFDNFY